jgi:hypothetical protein
MERIEIYDKVNACSTLEELSKVILELADEDGNIQGRTKKFNAERMADHCRNFSMFEPNVLTREFGIRQQAMYLAYYSK